MRQQRDGRIRERAQEQKSSGSQSTKQSAPVRPRPRPARPTAASAAAPARHASPPAPTLRWGRTNRRESARIANTKSKTAETAAKSKHSISQHKKRSFEQGAHSLNQAVKRWRFLPRNAASTRTASRNCTTMAASTRDQQQAEQRRKRADTARNRHGSALWGARGEIQPERTR